MTIIHNSRHIVIPAMPGLRVHAPRGTAAASSLLTDLVAYWKLDETSGNRADSGPNGLSLTDSGSVGYTTGKQGNAAVFDGTAKYLGRTSDAYTQTGDIDFTLAGWFRAANTNEGMLVTRDLYLAREYNLQWGLAPGWATFSVWDATDARRMAHVTGLTHSTWYYVVAWHDAAENTVNLQINNGTVASTSMVNAAKAAGTCEFRVGARAYVASEGYFNGTIDEVGFWKRVLTADERTALYNSGNGVTYPFTGI